jgi:hypothetical protein
VFNKKTKIEFVARSPYFEKVAPKPYPAKHYLPRWYKEMPSYNEVEDGKRMLTVRYGASSVTPKMCTPMYDSFTTGYIIPLWADVEVRQVNDQPHLFWRTKSIPFEMHGGWGSGGNDGVTGLTTPDGYSPFVFKWMNGWDFRTPKGYSCLVTDPYANENSPFKAIGAVLDTDKLTLSILPPFWIKEGFEGIVEKGTPMVQVIPFKRDSWESEYSSLKDGEYSIMEEVAFNSHIKNHYKRFVWTKKEFK